VLLKQRRPWISRQGITELANLNALSEEPAHARDPYLVEKSPRHLYRQ
jgi:hypothetical protein